MRWLETVEAILLGANTYRMFAAHWPSADPAVDAVAEPINRLPKYVVSNTLTSAPWGDAEIEILRGDAFTPAREVTRRHASTVVWGGLQLTDALLAADAGDRLRLRVVPVLIGAGRPFTQAALGVRAMHLERATHLPTGHVDLAYRLR